MADYGRFKRGKREFPLDASSSESLLFDADPFLYYALDFFQAMIERHVGARLMAAAADVPSIEAPVSYAVPIDPMPFLAQSTHYAFPLLGVYRKSGRLEDRTVGWRHDATTFEVVYILPPLDAGEAERVVPILTAIRDVLDDRARHGADPSYTPRGGAAGDPFWVDLAGIERVTFREAEWGVIPDGKGLPFYALRMRGEVCEREDTPATGFENFAGADLDVDMPDASGAVIASALTIATIGPPTITTVSPATGVYSGSVALTLTGTLYQNPVRVFVGGLEATNVVRTSATQITCTSPVHQESSVGTALDVTVVTDFGSATAAAAFTLTA